MEKSGAAGVTMRRVADEVGVTPMALYHHFKNRATLLDAVVASEFSNLERVIAEKQLSGSSKRRLTAILELYVSYASEHPCVFDYLFAEERENARRYPHDFRAGLSPTMNRLAEIVRSGMDAGEIKRGDVWEVAMCLSAHVHGYVMLRRAGRFELSEHQFRALVRRSIQSLLYGLAPAHPTSAR